ncbi:hypothetical protein A2334_03990 [Candidatus Roizmanbacteria bacterium RIFOXYB2_FULL_38_10]|uniref:Calcineurin-like phosphoesterase domain-containing protein n=1 Tax=Candidatus Roizmanbacteria bacterium RIFOXYD1_FULL_38_12 TaxID=1802093 RepID=A0A1F7KZG1_9BACT|nr:MAG: hypothetical protein A3K47_00100 [Candidatus Roizmanbacteria bacterium RIFOXYA2_FULL_38_14]OGK63203.1 MAG: hypothetical protein A3K27_00100 [Candidatus Roizmanbacteria bacterium RIFOXYA1_FULL_37_12]OGK65049.1 MAG: hypothetical protein A3K38_00100 [Candidatus Roizmanbacteria bacterium RIFOXYB1_FULL_40_23]OGK68604.1 MAG: hypothetical protein A2334_03990 [Candidatus Roizmanbacteria bacterium RIFOXYB2_FULL_38_10]OGK69452.1 MAG: hypothetical protein A3K21_00100 [Candidatus Roizmanbacteria ba
MKTLVFSDTHLGRVFEEEKYLFLKKRIEKVDQVVINGDFWDGYLTSFDAFLKSPWNQLFPLLKKKRTIYIYGNHDRKAFSDKKTSLFSIVQTRKYVLQNGGKTFVFEHGDRLLPSIDDRIPLSKQVLYYTTSFYTSVERVLTRSIRGTTRIWGFALNNKLKKFIEGKSEFFIFGHTHFAEFDLSHRFVNSGFIQHGLAQYLLIVNGNISPKQEWYK